MKSLRCMTSTLVALGVTAIAACGDGDDEYDTFGLTEGAVNIIAPGGDTVCSRGAPYEFFVIPGKTNKVIIEFEGGGACWNALTCSFADAAFKPEVEEPDWKDDVSQAPGFYNHAHEGHPMKDWWHIYIPYCTGDVHWGDAVKDYGNDLVINHKGSVNARAVLDWVYEHFPSPEKVFVTGCSAGGYGSIWWYPDVRTQYPDAEVYHFSDSAAGIITDDFFEQSLPVWNADPPHFENFDAVSSLTQFYEGVSSQYPGNFYSQYNTVVDETQTYFYTLMGGVDGAEGWSERMLASIGEISDAAPSFRYYLAEGDEHCILPYDDFYEKRVDGVRLTDWLAQAIGEDPPDNVACPDCDVP